MNVHRDLNMIGGEFQEKHLAVRGAVREEIAAMVRSLSADHRALSAQTIEAQVQQALERSPVGVVEALGIGPEPDAATQIALESRRRCHDLSDVFSR